MRLGADSPAFARIDVEQELIGVEPVAEVAKRRPLYARFGVRPEVAVENQVSLFCANAQLISIWIEQLDPILGAL
jgi:hypothetical protein